MGGKPSKIEPANLSIDYDIYNLKQLGDEFDTEMSYGHENNPYKKEVLKTEPIYSYYYRQFPENYKINVTFYNTDGKETTHSFSDKYLIPYTKDPQYLIPNPRFTDFRFYVLKTDLEEANRQIIALTNKAAEIVNKMNPELAQKAKKIIEAKTPQAGGRYNKKKTRKNRKAKKRST